MYANSTTHCSGRINVSGVLDRVQLSTTGGTVTFTTGKYLADM